MRIRQDRIQLITAGGIAILLLNQPYYPFLGKVGLTAFFSLLMHQRIFEKTPRILAQTILWTGLFIAGFYSFI
ncbi:MAG: hypothetical protein DWQ10_16685 [Calditrichaeota bacterium]|nr:MAG: hypothetical protein DWQ10_16685 [Calditrichota bacterium]